VDEAVGKRQTRFKLTKHVERTNAPAFENSPGRLSPRGEQRSSKRSIRREKMAESPFVFLRGTFWRWAETILEVCPDLAQAPTTLAVGDIHLENFGTWRDEDGRLVWGVSDFDEAAEMPFAIDLVRLATSALLAKPDREMPAREVCGAILAGYRQGLEEPQAIVLDRDWAWLRQLVVVSDKARAKFWKKIAQAEYKPAPRRYVEALASAMPEANLQIRTAPRTAGTEAVVRQFLTLEATRWQYVTGVSDESLVDPESWYHDYALLSRPGNDEVQLALFRDYATNSPLYPRVHEYFRTTGVPLLAVWGRGDEIFGPDGARAFADDLPDAEIHLLDGGHFLLETAHDDVARLIRDFLGRRLSSG